VQPLAPGPSVLLRDPSSSQELSALLLAAAALPTAPALEVRGTVPSWPYLNLTQCVLERFGVRIESKGGEAWQGALSVLGELRSPGPIAIESDASSAAVALAAACLAGGSMRCPGFPSTSAQGDLAIVQLLHAFGCQASHEGDTLHASGAPTRGARLDLAATPDLAPVLAILAAAAAERTGEASELHGLGTLLGKESDRLAVLSRGLSAAGWEVQADASSLRIGAPKTRTPADLVLDPDADHRMAFAFALLGLLRPGLRVAHPGCVAKSWPSFWDELACAD